MTKIPSPTGESGSVPETSEAAKKWREARQKYLGVDEEVPRIVMEARRELENWKATMGRIDYSFRRDSFDVQMERVAAIVWQADELAKRPALNIQLYPDVR